MAMGNIMAWVRRYYDRILAGIILIGLMASLSYLAWQVGSVRTAQDRFLGTITRLAPRYPVVDPTDDAMYRAALQALQEPYQLGWEGWTNAMFVPETRIWCVDCRRPMPIEAEVCPLCGARQPPESHEAPDRDLDVDGMPDEWELKYGLNPGDPSDAHSDADGDGFTNLEEYRAGTDPTDPTHYPDITTKLCLERVTADPFELLFKSVSKMPDGNRFAINTRKQGRTHFKRLGEEVEGFTLHEFEERFREEPFMTTTRKVNESVLTLKRGEEEIPLTINRDVQYSEYSVALLFTGLNLRFDLQTDDTFQLLDQSYRLTGIDTRGASVVITRMSDGQKINLRRCSEGGKGAVDSALPESGLDQGEPPR